jgi:hypothetical protein
LLWPYPLRESFFRPTLLERWLGVGVSRHWVWHEAGRLQASVSVRGIFDRGAWQLVLLVEPARQGRIERELLAEILARNEFQYASVGLEYPAGLAQDALLNLGFQAEHSLTWMALSL